jgi:hypothetical protein
VLIQTLIAELAVEALDEGILDRFAGLDVMPLNPVDGTCNKSQRKF